MNIFGTIITYILLGLLYFLGSMFASIFVTLFTKYGGIFALHVLLYPIVDWQYTLLMLAWAVFSIFNYYSRFWLWNAGEAYEDLNPFI